jgi:endoglucanase
MPPRFGPVSLRALASRILFGIVLTLAMLPIADATKSAGSLLAAPSPLRVSGNRLVDAASLPIQLRGVNRMSFEYACAQDWGIVQGPIDQAAVSGITSWGSNVVRILLNEHCWLGIDDGAATPQVVGEPYRQAVQSFVDLLIANGMYVILDLHWSAPAGQPAAGQKPMPNTSYSAAFWQSVADTFKGRDQVLFDLFNEAVPNNNANDGSDEAARRSWECWRDGGTASCDETLSLGPPETAMSASQAVGMQALVDAVRGTGATNVILVGGIQWANTLWSSATHNWLSYKPTDPLGNLAAAVHIYPNTWCKEVTCYDREIAPVAAQAPVIATEFGFNGCDAPAAQWLNTLMSWLDAHQSGYLAWIWNAPDACANGNLIADWDGTPSQYGQIYKAHLDGLR